MHIVSGTYEMGLGFDSKELPNCSYCGESLVNDKGWIECSSCGISLKEDPPATITEISKLILGVDSYYEMLVPESWHYVRPINNIVKSVMLTDKKFTNGRENFTLRPEKPLIELKNERAEEIRKWFLLYYETLQS
jgi:hypothetical protein